MKKFIAIYEIVGGIISLIFIFVSLGAYIGYSSRNSVNTYSLIPWANLFNMTTIIIIVSIILVSCLLVAGIMLLRNNKLGYFLSIGIQILQSVVIQTSHFHYQFYTPAGLVIGFGEEGVKFMMKLGLSYALVFKQPFVSDTYIGFNIMSLIILTVLFFLFRREKYLGK